MLRSPISNRRRTEEALQRRGRLKSAVPIRLDLEKEEQKESQEWAGRAEGNT